MTEQTPLQNERFCSNMARDLLHNYTTLLFKLMTRCLTFKGLRVNGVFYSAENGPIKCYAKDSDGNVQYSCFLDRYNWCNKQCCVILPKGDFKILQKVNGVAPPAGFLTYPRPVTTCRHFVISGKFTVEDLGELLEEEDRNVNRFVSEVGHLEDVVKFLNKRSNIIYGPMHENHTMKDIKFINTRGINTDTRGKNFCMLPLPWKESTTIKPGCNLYTLIKKFFLLRSHKCDGWYELFTNAEYKYVEEEPIIELDFDHGS